MNEICCYCIQECTGYMANFSIDDYRDFRYSSRCCDESCALVTEEQFEELKRLDEAGLYDEVDNYINSYCKILDRYE